MVALAPITNERPAWDVLDTFPKLHSRAREAKSGNPLSKSLTYSYDAVGNRRSLDAPDSGRFSYIYDAAEQLSSVLNPFSELTTFSYDIAGRRTVQRYSNGTRASIIYDTANNVTQFHNRTSTGTAITTNDYKYDNVGNRTGMLEASGDRLTWTYDNGDQLKSERRSGASGYANTFTYDGVGNRTLKNAGATRTTFSYDIADQLVYSQSVAGRTSYVYDNAGNQQIEQPPTGSRTTTVWDNENRPTLYRLPDTSLVTMSYNGNNRRVTKQSATETVKFVWDPAADAYLAEFNSSNVLQATYSQEPVQFGRAISQRRSTTSNWYHTDALGSTQALSNSSQITSDTYLYDAWGNPITSTGTTVNPFRWVGNVGYYFDSDTGLYYIRARTYQPTIARWTSADPLFYMLAKAGVLGVLTRDLIGFGTGQFSLYEYVTGRSLVRVDAFGLYGFGGDIGPCLWWLTRYRMGGENDVDLVKFNLFDEWRQNSGVSGPIEKAKDEVMAKTGGMFLSCDGKKGELSTSISGNKKIETQVFGVPLCSRIGPIGGSSFTMAYSCELTADCDECPSCPGIYDLNEILPRLRCNFSFDFEDQFSNPGDYGHPHNKPIDLAGFQKCMRHCRKLRGRPAVKCEHKCRKTYLVGNLVPVITDPNGYPFFIRAKGAIRGLRR